MSAQPAFSRHLISVTDYYRMADAGIFTEDQHIELINGEIFDMAPMGSFHADIIDALTRIFYQQPESDYYRLHLRPRAGENIQPLLVEAVSVDWSGLFSY